MGEAPPSPDALLRVLDAVDALLGEVDADGDPERAQALGQVHAAVLQHLRAHARDWAGPP